MSLLALWPYVFAAAAAALLPIQAAMNGALNRAFQQPPLVVAISLSGSLLFIGAVAGLDGRLTLPEMWRVAGVPWWAWPAGVCGAVFLLSQPVVLPRIGAAAFVAVGVTAQLVAAMVLDHVGALRLPQHDASPLRLLGVALMVLGVTLVARF